jgi:hypothetical protein
MDSRNGSLTCGFSALIMLVGLAGASRVDGQGLDVGIGYVGVRAGQLTESIHATRLVSGFAGRATLRLLGGLGFEGEASALYPSKESGLLGSTPGRKTELLFGVRYGLGVGMVGVYGKVRGGYLRSKFTLVTNPPVKITESDFVIDWGGIVELRTPGRLSLRADVGDLWIPSNERNSYPFGTHNLRIGVGAAWSLN